MNLKQFEKNIIVFLGAISSIVTIWQLFCDLPKLGIYIIIAICILYILSLAVWSLKKVLLINKAIEKVNNFYNQLNLQTSEGLHKFMHTFRDVDIFVKNNNITKEHFQALTAKICECIENFYNDLLETSTSVCLKLISSESSFDSNISNWQIETLARSAGTDPNRLKNDNEVTTIDKNTDFKIIVSEEEKFKNEDFFVSSNLYNIDNKLFEEFNIKYENSHQNYLRYYKSTIVVPIRAEIKNTPPELTTNKTNMYHILGFLCIDSNETFNDTVSSKRKKFLLGITYAKVFGDSLYILLNKYYSKTNSNSNLTKSNNQKEVIKP